MISTIHLRGDAESKRVWLNGEELFPQESQKIRNHSPDGFNWGYGGSGPAQLALAICMKLYGVPENYQEFKRLYIQSLPTDSFDLHINISTFSHESN